MSFLNPKGLEQHQFCNNKCVTPPCTITQARQDRKQPSGFKADKIQV